MKKILLFQAVILILTAVLPLAAQDGDFFPYVSRVRAENRNNLIRLTWTDSPDARGPVYIYRSARSFGGSVPANLRPIVVNYGTQYYIDDAEDMENIHYFIAASDTTGKRYDIVIPGINSAGIVNGHPMPQSEETSYSPVGTAPVNSIYNLTARLDADGESVVITYRTQEPRENAVLYRSMQPIRQPVDLLNAVIVQSAFASPFVDFPMKGIPWYYAVIYEDEILTGNMTIIPGHNVTTYPIIIYGSEQTAKPSLRSIPLPLLTLDAAAPIGGAGGFLTDGTRNTPLSAASEKMLRNSIRYANKPPLVLKSPRVFVVDMQFPAGGEESALFQIVEEYFQKFDWQGALVSLQHYLSLPRSPDIEARARFYLGQTLYFTERYREALLEFLSLRSFHPVEANLWIEAVLAAMVY
jgi:hypothetical protein